MTSAFAAYAFSRLNFAGKGTCPMLIKAISRFPRSGPQSQLKQVVRHGMVGLGMLTTVMLLALLM